jgi:transposase
MQQGITDVFGMDLGDSKSMICAVDAQGEPLEESTVRTTREGVGRYFGGRAPAIVAIEVGTHSRWVSELLESMGHTVYVANARRLRQISENDKKTDKMDARLLGEMARLKPKMLHPIKHRTDADHMSRAIVVARDQLVRNRTSLITHVRSVVKAVGTRLPSCSAESFHKQAAGLPAGLEPALKPLIDIIETMTREIRRFERKIDKTLEAQYPDSKRLQTAPVGPITTLAYMAAVGDPSRFPSSRKVGSYFGLRRKKQESGNYDPELRITKAGDPYVRRLLVSAGQRLLTELGEDCELRRWGLKLMNRGGKGARNRAAVAVARKLAGLLHHLWLTGEEFKAFPRGKPADEVLLSS